MTSGRRLFCLLLSIVVAPMKKFTLQSLKVADGKLSERSCWLVKAQLEEPEEQAWLRVVQSRQCSLFSTSESARLCLSDVLL